MTKNNKTKQSDDNKLILIVTSRNIFGKKLNKQRKEGLLPGNIYGANYKSKSINSNLKDFLKVYRTAKETKIIYLNLDKEEIPVLIKQVQKHPVNDSLLHVDFRKVDLQQKIETQVPIKVLGQSEAVSQKGGVLLTLSKTLTVEALPQDIPQNIDIDITKLKEIGQEIKVGNLPPSTKYSIKDLANKVIISVVAHKEESITPETTTTTPEVITEKPEEGETTATKTEEKITVKETKETKEVKTSTEKPKEQKPQPAKAK